MASTYTLSLTRNPSSLFYLIFLPTSIRRLQILSLQSKIRHPALRPTKKNHHGYQEPLLQRSETLEPEQKHNPLSPSPPTTIYHSAIDCESHVTIQSSTSIRPSAGAPPATLQRSTGSSFSGPTPCTLESYRHLNPCPTSPSTPPQPYSSIDVLAQQPYYQPTPSSLPAASTHTLRQASTGTTFELGPAPVLAAIAKGGSDNVSSFTPNGYWHHLMPNAIQPTPYDHYIINYATKPSGYTMQMASHAHRLSSHGTKPAPGNENPTLQQPPSTILVKKKGSATHTTRVANGKIVVQALQQAITISGVNHT